MRIAVASISQETCSFSPVLTTLEDFRQFGLYEGHEILERSASVGTVGGFLAAAQDESVDITPLPIIRGEALAGGTISADTLRFFEEKLVSGLKHLLPIDGLFLDLHGAAAAENEPDVEGHLLTAARQVVGDGIPVVVPLDHHGSITQRIVDHADALVGHRTQPHDPFDTGKLAAKMLFRLVRREISPVMAWRRIPMIAPQEQFLTQGGPMKEWFDLARQFETLPGVLSASNFPIQPWLDVPEGGWTAVVITDNDAPLAQRLAADLANRVWRLRADFWKLDSLPAAEAVRRAVKAKRGLAILSDTGDSVFGGATGDSTILLREMLEQRITCAALVPMVDPEVVEIAWQAGMGGEITVKVGGKFDNIFSAPVEVTGKVAGLAHGWLAAEVVGLEGFDMGRSALLEVGSIKLMVSERRGVGGNHPIVYRQFGVEPADAKIVVLKTASNFQYYASMMSELVRADTLGGTTSHLEELNWRRLPRPIYPLDDLPAWEATI